MPTRQHDYTSSHKTDPTAKVIEQATLISALRAQMELMGLSGQKLAEEYRMRCASTLLSAGINLIPCEHLSDQMFAVSPGVYEAAKKLANATTDEWRKDHVG